MVRAHYKRGDIRWTDKVTIGNTDKKRPKGRPFSKWWDEIKKFTECLHQIQKQEAQRNKWKCLEKVFVLKWNDMG